MARMSGNISLLFCFGFLIPALRVQLPEAATVDRPIVVNRTNDTMIHFPEESDFDGKMGDVSGKAKDNVAVNGKGSVTGKGKGNVTGSATGNVIGSASRNVTGDVNGKVTGNVTGDANGSVAGIVTEKVTGNVNIEPYFIIDAPIRSDDEDHGCSRGQRWSFGHCREILD